MIMNKRLLVSISSIIIAVIIVSGLSQFGWSPVLAYIAYAALAFFFFGILVSNQQYEEDLFSKIERMTSAFLLSYLIFFRFLFAPLSQLFLGGVNAGKNFFLTDILLLILFAIFFFLFGTAFLVVNKFSQTGFLPNFRFFNNENMFFILRGLFISAVAVFFLFYLRNSFFSINNSYYMNNILPPSTCNWTYIKYPNFLSIGQTVTGRDVCLYNYSQDKYDPKYCDLIKNGETRELCKQYFISEAEN